MSNHNYSQYSNKNKKNNTNNNPNKAAVAPIVETPKPIVQPAPILVQETVETVKLPDTVKGFVANCGKLNVRVAPNPDADVACVLNAQSEVVINVTESTDEWFSICTAAGMEGYCMRKYIDAYL